jgi:chromosome partitioning protein
MILTVGHTKGGAGKTTLAVQIALTQAIAGRDVLLVDGDAQRSAQTAMTIRTKAGRTPGLACVHFTDGPLLRSQVQRQASKYQDVVIDAGGHDSATLRAAVSVCDAVLVPFVPRSIDVWALEDMAKLIEEARSIRDGLLALAVLNRADPGASPDNREAAAALADFPVLTLLDSPIGNRKAIANATGQGLAVSELTPRDPKACDEIASLIRNVFIIADNLHCNGSA